MWWLSYHRAAGFTNYVLIAHMRVCVVLVLYEGCAQHSRPKTVLGDRKRSKIKRAGGRKKSWMIRSICVEFTSVRTRLGSRVGQAAFGGRATQSNGLIWRFVFPPSGIWCQFSESFGPNCGWNVDHHSPHLSGQPCPTKTTRHCYHGLLEDAMAAFGLRLTFSIFISFVLFSYLVCFLVLLHSFCWISTQILLKP